MGADSFMSQNGFFQVKAQQKLLKASSSQNIHSTLAYNFGSSSKGPRASLFSTLNST